MNTRGVVRCGRVPNSRRCPAELRTRGSAAASPYRSGVHPNGTAPSMRGAFLVQGGRVSRGDRSTDICLNRN